MKRIPGGGRLSIAPPQFYPKGQSSLDVAGLLAIISNRPRQRYALAVDLETAFCICDCRMYDNPIVYTSTSFEKLTGYSEEECLGRNCRFLQGADTDRAVVKKIRRSFDEGTEERFQILNYRKDGTTFINFLTLLPIYDNEDDMNIVYCLGIQSAVPFEEVRVSPVVMQTSSVTMDSQIAQGSEFMDDQRSMLSGFTGEVMPSNSIHLFRIRDEGSNGVCSQEASGADEWRRRTYLGHGCDDEEHGRLERRRDEGDSGIEHSGDGRRMAAHVQLEELHRQLASVTPCRQYLAKKAGGKMEGKFSTKTRVLQLLAYLEGVVEGINE